MKFFTLAALATLAIATALPNPDNHEVEKGKDYHKEDYEKDYSKDYEKDDDCEDDYDDDHHEEDHGDDHHGDDDYHTLKTGTTHVNCKDRHDPQVKKSPTLTLCYQLADAQTTKIMKAAYIKACQDLCTQAALVNGGNLPPNWR